MFSALKHQGQPLYKLARQGIDIEREARPVTIFSFEMVDFRPGNFAEADVEIHCSKGTYIRTLAEDIGRKLGCGAYVSKLHRTAAGPFGESDTITLKELEDIREEQPAESLDFLLKPMDAGIQYMMSVELSEDMAFYFQQGQPIMVPQAYRQGEEGDIVRVFEVNGPFLGVGEMTDDGKVAPKRLVVM